MQVRDQATIGIVFGGARLPAVPGETVAATLIANGAVWHSVAKNGDPRGAYCGMGVCHDCVVSIDGRRGQRACLAKVADGMRVERQSPYPVPLGEDVAELGRLPAGAPAPSAMDLLVVGAGPAGLAAALSARRAGADVLIVDERPAPGGQYFKQAADPRAIVRDAQALEGRRLIDDVQQAGVTLAGETLVWGGSREAGGALEITTFSQGSVSVLRPRVLVIATGAYERPVLVPGWTLPGVMTTGAAQTLLRGYGVPPGQRILVAGNGPLNLQLAAELLSSVQQVTVVEAAPAPWVRPRVGLCLFAADAGLAAKGLATIARLMAARAPIHWRHRLIAVEGAERAKLAIIAPVATDGTVDRSRAFSVAADAVITGDGFWPASELARLLGCRASSDGIDHGADGATSVPEVFVAGEAGGFGGAQIALAEGHNAGAAAARRLGLPVADSNGSRLHGPRRFQSALWRLFAATDMGMSLATASTVICRCETVTLARLQDTIDRHGVGDIGTLKRLTRAGMGRCQGRYCAPRLAALLRDPAGTGLAPQMPLRPLPLVALAVEKPEWSGHRRTLLPAQPALPPGDPLPIAEAATVIIGAGIVGLSTALFLARAGHEVAVIDSRVPNAGASGANAGSLHAQLLSFDHGAKASASGGAAAKTLPLQRESIALWRRLAGELGQDMEIKLTGGLMVAETERDLLFLRAKTEVERAQGVDCTVIDAAELRRLEPHLDRRFLGAAFCPDEGKINPLTATEAIRQAAVAAGAIVLGGAALRGISCEGRGFILDTARGALRAGRLVNAAGGFAREIGAMLGLGVPVFGAPLQMVVTEAAEPLVSCLVAHADRHLTLKQAANGTIIIGGGWTGGLDPVHGHPRPMRESLEGNLWIAQHVLPALRKLHVLRSWAAMNIDIDGAPILGEHPAMPGFFNAVTSNGYTLGPIMGLLTAELILRGHADRDLSAFSVARFGHEVQEVS